MEEFLSNCRRAVQNWDQTDSRFHVVLGNEAGDIDSMVCSLVYAYFLSQTVQSETLAVPLINLRQVDLVLRSDNLSLLRLVGLDPDLLLFRDQLDLQELLRAGRLQLTLVDHNLLPSSDRSLEEAVVEVIDHHLLEREPSPTCSITVEMVGSCATLVTERILREAPQVLDQQAAQLLYAAVVLDCVNMAPAAGKVTPKDSELAAALETRFPSLPPRGALFQTLNQAKFDVSGLSTEQMLLKDQKVVSGSLNLAVSVLYVSLEDFLRRRGLEDELSDFCLQSGLDLLLLMTISFSESQQPIRELAVYSPHTACREEASQFLEAAQNQTLRLCPMSSQHPHLRAYHQGNSLASRKKLLPLLKDFLLDWDERGCLRDLAEEAEPSLPATPMNSLVDGCPLDAGLPHLSAADLEDKVSKMADRQRE